MTKKNRLILVSICVIFFLILTPYIILYSIGYRIDLENIKITATGGVYVRVLPKEVNIIIDNKISNATGLFSNSVFVQNLLPREHIILIKKDGYHDYNKNLIVQENKVTKLENVILFKKDIAFEILKDMAQFSLLKQGSPEKFVIKNNNLYYSDIQENQLTARQKKDPLLKNIVTYKLSDNKIIWLGLDGFLESSDLNGNNSEKLSQTALKINKKSYYLLTILSQDIFLKENNNLLVFNKETKSFQNFYNMVKEIEVSPDGKKLLLCNDNEILFFPGEQKELEKIFSKNSLEKISNCLWLNDSYVIYVMGNPPSPKVSAGQSKIIISETDNRGNVNSINLPEMILIADGKSISFKNPEIFFNWQENKLYVSTEPFDSGQGKQIILVSEKLIP